MATFEDTIAILKGTRPFDLPKHMNDIIAGMEDLLTRVQRLEEAERKRNASS